MINISDFFNYSFLFNALIGSVGLSIACGIISPYIIARKKSMMGPTIAHSTFLSASIASIISIEYFSIITAAITIFSVIILAKQTFKNKLPPDSLMGIYLTITMALGIIVQTIFKSSGQLSIQSFLFGDILLLNNTDLTIISILVVFIAYIFFRHKNNWDYTTFDEEEADLDGVNIALYHYLFYILLGLIIVCAVKISGTILSNALLLIPGMFALKISKNAKSLIKISLIFSVSTVLVGLIIANWTELPVGPMMALTQFIVFMIGKTLIK